MQAAPRHSRIASIAPALLAATVFAFAAGSSSISSVTRIGHGARWIALAVLFAAAAVWLGRDAVAALRSRAGLAALGFSGLALLSAAWSVAPRITAEKAISLGLLLATAVLVAAAARQAPERVELLLAGLLGGAVLVALAGLLLLVVAHGHAVTPASYETPARFQGFGQNPNTGALLFALTLPIGVWSALAGRTRTWRLAGAGATALLFGSIVASGSRGALTAGAVGALVPALAWAGTRRRALVAVAAVVLAAVVGVAIQQIPKAAPVSAAAPAAGAKAAPKKPKPKPYLNADAYYPLDADIGGPLPGGGQPALSRSFLSSSGRLTAWRGAVHQAEQRPLLGHGFGTEGRVFVDRYYNFVGDLPENSYVGMGLQLGLVGLAALLGLVGLLVWPIRRARDRVLVAAPLGVVAAGLVMGVVQSYLYSVGNIATGTFWIAAFLVAAAAGRTGANA